MSVPGVWTMQMEVSEAAAAPGYRLWTENSDFFIKDAINES